jgi:SRSO17 transposase
MTDQQLTALDPILRRFLDTFLGCCSYVPTFVHLYTYVIGLLSDLSRKSVEPIALRAGTPVRTLQQFLRDHVWDHGQVRDRLQCHVAASIESRRNPKEPVVGILDDTSVLKCGSMTPGVQRQYLNCVGKVDNGIVLVHLGVAQGSFKTLIDAELFIPELWSNDRKRCREAGIPDEVVHRRKWETALEQCDRAKANGISLDWLTFDEGYGQCPAFLTRLNGRGMRFIGEIPRVFSCMAANRTGGSPQPHHRARPACEVVQNSSRFRSQSWRIMRLSRRTLPDQVWRFKASPVWLHGAEGWSERTYWLIWASNDETGEEKFFLCNGEDEGCIEEWLRVAFMRWNIEHSFRVVKGELGFGHYEGRSYQALHRHLSLCLVAMTFVAEQTERLRGEKPTDHDRASLSSDEGDLPELAEPSVPPPSASWVSAGGGDHPLPPTTQRGGKSIQTQTSRGRSQPQKTSTSQAKTRQKTQAKVHREFKVALYY